MNKLNKQFFEAEREQVFRWVDVMFLCSQYGYSYRAITIQNIFKKWKTDEIVDDLGKELAYQFYRSEKPYREYLKEVR